MIDDTYDDVVRLELVRVRLEPLGTEPLTIDECAVGAFHVFNEDLLDVTQKDKWFVSVPDAFSRLRAASPGATTHLPTVLPHFCVLPAEHLGVKVAIALLGDGLRVRLAADLDALVGSKGDVFRDESVV